MIDNILLKQVGSLVKCFLDLSIIYCNGRDLDHWLLCNNFIVKPPSPKALFPNLLELTLKFIKFRPAKENYVLNTPLLSSLTLISFNGVHLLTYS
ncbi:hypothetical protein H5410_056796 [Solanum commersonii]|uniref:Uncharacterized protein n=1 Tax=Solanum commersonii TaxID=4109 RepID=A0A9J5WP32_SOLCO|nr:hypothetical protein H5410_056796 [Solanum commersonii]